MIQEGTHAFENGMRVLNDSVIANAEMGKKIGDMLFGMQGKVIEYADGYLEEVFPSRNLSSAVLFREVRESFGYLTEKVIGNASFHTDGDAKNGSLDYSLNEVEALTGRGIFGVMPLTTLLINQLSLRNFTNAQNLLNGASNELVHLYTAFQSQDLSNTTLFTSEFLTKAQDFSYKATFMTLGSVTNILLFVLSFIFTTFDYLSKGIVFWIVFGTCVSSKGGIIGSIGKVFMIIDKQGRVSGMLEHVLETILFTHAKRMMFHFLLGWLSFSIIGSNVPIILKRLMILVCLFTCNNDGDISGCSGDRFRVY